MLQQLFCFFKFREELFFLLESFGMHTAAAAVQFYWMLEMKHLVIDKIFDGIFRNVGTIEHPADDNSVVCGIVVAEALARRVTTPGHQRPGQKSVKEPLI